MDDTGLSGLSGGAAAVGASAEMAALAAGAGAAPGPTAGHGPAANCLNCQAALAPQARFCSQCGQDTANHPPSLFEFVHEFVSHYIAVEGTLWKSLWGLMAKPGFLTREYLAGRKQRYVLPLRLLLTLGLVFFLVLKLVPGSHHVGPEVLAGEEAAEVAADAASAASAVQAAASAVLAEAARAKAPMSKASASLQIVDKEFEQSLPPGVQERLRRTEDRWRADPGAAAKAMGATMLGLAPYAVLCSLPFFAGLMKLLFWRQPYGAHFVFAMHLHAAWYGMLLLAVLLPWGPVLFGVWLWSNLYPVIALKRVHAASWWTTVLRGAVLAVMHWVLISLGLGLLAVVGAIATS